MKKVVSSVFAVAMFCTVLLTFIGCGKGSNISKILREDATEASMNWLSLIKEYGVNYEWNDSTLLGEAIKAGRVDMVEALIKDKADVNRPAVYYTMIATIGIPPLWLASGNGLGTDRVILGIQATPEALSKIRVMLINAGANVQTETMDILLQSVALPDEAAFEAALPKYKKEMLDYSLYGKEEYKAGRNPFRFVSDENFESQKTMLQKLMKKGIEFGFYDTAMAITMYLDPNLATYGDEFLYDILSFMTKQRSFNMLTELPEGFIDDNPQYINPLDLTIGTLYLQRFGDNIFSTDPDLYLKVVTLFGGGGLQATPYNWSVPYQATQGYDKSSTGTLPMFLRIIASKIKQEIAVRKAYEDLTSQSGLWDPELYKKRYEDKKNTVVYGEWTPEVIINAFEVLSKYNALYYSLEATDNYHLNDEYPPEYLYRQVLTNGQHFNEDLTLSYNDLFEPYYPVFEWLNKNGYLVFGTKDYLAYEDGLNVSEYFSTLDKRIVNRDLIPNSTDPNDRYVNIEYIRFRARINPLYGEVVLVEAEEIISGKRVGFSKRARDVLSRDGLPWNVTTKNVDPYGKIIEGGRTAPPPS